MIRRTRQMARADRREQLLKIARQLVAKEGMGALTMMALSERAKVAKPVVYSHFANRSEVAIALLDEHFEAVIAFVRKRLAGASTLEDYFSRLVDASFEFESPSDTPVRRITNGFSAGDEVNQAFLRHEEEFRKHWEQLLQLFGVRRELIAVAAYALSIMLDNTIYTFAITPQRKVARETLKAMLLAALHALAPDRKRRLHGVPEFEASAGEAKAPRTNAGSVKRGKSERIDTSKMKMRGPFAQPSSDRAAKRR
jgi:AcrR family transcriptional regulator